MTTRRPRVPDEKPVKKPVAGTMPGRNGGTLRRGGTNKGGSGRPPMTFPERCRALLDDQRHRDAFAKVLMDSKHPASAWALRHATQYAQDKPTQPIEADRDATPMSYRVWLASLLEDKKHRDEGSSRGARKTKKAPG